MTTIQNINSITAITDTITILTCTTPNTKLTKEFTLRADGTVHKQAYGKAKNFTYEEKTVSNLNEMLVLLTDLQQQPLSCIIRGKPKQDAGDVVRRLLHDDGADKATFDPQPRHWVMLDLDKISCPAHLNPATARDDAAKWAQQTLCHPFNNASCIYKFSSSQNVMGSGDTVSLHFMFWMDRAVSEQELKWFFKENPCNVDQALFSAVQIHYTSGPIFHGMEDPLPKRVGMLIGETDIVAMPKITLPKAKKSSVLSGVAPSVGTENLSKASAMLLASYPKSGGRDRFCGTVAGVLCRGGWPAEQSADFVMELAEAAHDEESSKRYDTGMRICDAIANDRKAMGIPVLSDEYGVQELDEILELLGVGKPDIGAVIAKLSNVSSPEEINQALKLLLTLPLLEREINLEAVAEKTNKGKTLLGKILKNMAKSPDGNGAVDRASVLMEMLLDVYYESGRHLLRTAGVFWEYNGKIWVIVEDDQLKQRLLLLVEEVAEENDKFANLVSAAMSLLAAKVYKEGDPLRFNSDPLMVRGCKNGELWLDEQANVTFKPHSPESYLRHCVQTDFDPAATAPEYEKAMLEIFANSSNPFDMYRHVMELMGYLSQSWRKIPTIALLYGGGNNGKSSLTSMLAHMIGESSIMSHRISDIEKNPFKIGALANKLVLIDDDVDSGILLPDGFLKKISEEKPMTGEHKYRDPFEFKCRAVPVMLANEFPAIKDLTFGFSKRLQVIPFAREFEPHEVKLELFNELWAKESSGILNEFIAGFQRLKKRGAFLQPEDCKECKKEWLYRANVLNAFISEMCDKDEEKQQSLAMFYQYFCEYCHDCGVKNVPSRAGIEKRLNSLKYKLTYDGQPAILGLYANKYPVMKIDQKILKNEVTLTNVNIN